MHIVLPDLNDDDVLSFLHYIFLEGQRYYIHEIYIICGTLFETSTAEIRVSRFFFAFVSFLFFTKRVPTIEYDT
jgi:hypothetical protein